MEPRCAVEQVAGLVGLVRPLLNDDIRGFEPLRFDPDGASIFFGSRELLAPERDPYGRLAVSKIGKVRQRAFPCQQGAGAPQRFESIASLEPYPAPHRRNQVVLEG